MKKKIAKKTEKIAAPKTIAKLIRFRKQDFKVIQKLAKNKTAGNVTEWITQASLNG